MLGSAVAEAHCGVTDAEPTWERRVAFGMGSASSSFFKPLHDSLDTLRTDAEVICNGVEKHPVHLEPAGGVVIAFFPVSMF